jgi:hypothetical protein
MLITAQINLIRNLMYLFSRNCFRGMNRLVKNKQQIITWNIFWNFVWIFELKISDEWKSDWYQNSEPQADSIPLRQQSIWKNMYIHWSNKKTFIITSCCFELMIAKLFFCCFTSVNPCLTKSAPNTITTKVFKWHKLL